SACIGTQVEVISSDPADAHSVERISELAGTIPYEITCGLGGRVRRAIIN
ncbi:MAG: alanine racemase, partial [Phycisphaerales bacterium]|nr:alanine racemase [Phycisphaerales bacterium]